jgi:antitoxin component YwqK of YwqJK toxin-antitoxin module
MKTHYLVILATLAFPAILAVSCSGGKKEDTTASLPDGIRVVKEYYKNGRLKSETQAMGKLRHGESREYRKDGTLENLIIYENNRKHGPARNYYADGKTVKTEIQYVNGFKNGQAKWYYPDGKIYRITPYENGKIHGIRTTFYENGNKQAEIPYKSGQPGIGLKEYNSDGTPRNSNVKIIFSEQDRISMDNSFRLSISLSSGNRSAEFYRGKLTEGKYWNVELSAIPTENGVGVMEFYIPKGTFKMETINIVAREKTSLNNYRILQGEYHLALENKF